MQVVLGIAALASIAFLALRLRMSQMQMQQPPMLPPQAPPPPPSRESGLNHIPPPPPNVVGTVTGLMAPPKPPSIVAGLPAPGVAPGSVPITKPVPRDSLVSANNPPPPPPPPTNTMDSGLFKIYSAPPAPTYKYTSSPTTVANTPDSGLINILGLQGATAVTKPALAVVVKTGVR